MTLSAATPPAVPPAAPPSAVLNRCGSCAAWWGEPNARLGVCTLHDVDQLRDAVACPEWTRRSTRPALRSVQ